MCKDRRSFMKTACLACFCGCVPEQTASAEPTADVDGQAEAPPTMPQKWIAGLVPLLAEGDRENAKRILRAASASHYEHLKMQATLEKFRGKPDEFLAFLRKEWGWVIDYDRTRGIINIDENKSACVCPLVPKNHGNDMGILCYCSEGFAGKMFSEVFGAPVRAEVTESILRGNKSCKYRIDLKPVEE